MIDTLIPLLPPDERAWRWLADALRRIADDDAAILELFPAVRRVCGRGPLPGVPGWTIDESARLVLLQGLAAPRTTVPEVYRYGDTAEKIAVLKALPLLDVGPDALPLVRDALRTNDTRLIEAAVGPYAAGHLPAHEYRQAVLKCVFVGIPLSAVAGLERRADRELARMLADYAHERTVAGRDVPEDVQRFADVHNQGREGH
ncbi:MAG TPA: EboA domain-containing protein [Thermomonospora sp.]|nr:EboA domain-containing protein [Thermomonospora sp.]